MRALRFLYRSGQHATVLPNAPALETRALCVGYPGTTTPVLHGLTCCVPPGTRIALVGPNGAGKSTLFKAITGLLPACSGDIRIYGHPVGACHHRVAYLPQRSEIDWTFPMCVRQLVLTGRYIHLGWLRRPGQQDKSLVAATLKRLGLEAVATLQVGHLSGGQQQRVLLARALVQEADLLLLDEPLNAVDVDTQTIVVAVLAELQQQGKTVLIATHDWPQGELGFEGALYLCGGRVTSPPQGAFVGLRVGRQTCTG